MEMEMAKDPFLEARFYRTELIENRFTTCNVANWLFKIKSVKFRMNL